MCDVMQEPEGWGPFIGWCVWFLACILAGCGLWFGRG